MLREGGELFLLPKKKGTRESKQVLWLFPNRCLWLGERSDSAELQGKQESKAGGLLVPCASFTPSSACPLLAHTRALPLPKGPLSAMGGGPVPVGNTLPSWALKMFEELETLQAWTEQLKDAHLRSKGKL